MAISLFSQDFLNFNFQPQMQFLGRSLSSCTDTLCPVDIDETTNNTLLKMDLPGVSADNIKVDIKDGLLTVSGVRNYDKDYGYFERSHGKFSRSFRIGDTTDISNVSASLDQGVLTIIIPKIESESYSIPVHENSKEHNNPVDLSVEHSDKNNPRRSPRNRGKCN